MVGHTTSLTEFRCINTIKHPRNLGNWVGQSTLLQSIKSRFYIGQEIKTNF